MIKIAVIGDSISGLHGNWTTKLKETLDNTELDVKVFNLAICGSTFYKAIQSQVQACISFNPDKVFVMLGINDCIFTPSRAESQIIQDGVLLYNTIKSRCPLAQVILVVETPHSVSEVGWTPSTLFNRQAIPSSHSLISVDGKPGVRINNNTYFNASISSTKLNQHKVWGRVLSTLSATYDSYILVDLFKISRLGLNIDEFHPNSFGQMWIANAILKWLRSKGILKANPYQGSDEYLGDLDLYFNRVSTIPTECQLLAGDYGVDILKSIRNWFYKRRQSNTYVGPSDIAQNDFVMIKVEGSEPNRPTFFSWEGTMPLTLTSHYTDDKGEYGIFFSPKQLGLNVTPGQHLCRVGVLLSDGTTDAYEQRILVV